MERIPVDQGVTLYRRGVAWWLDIVQDGKRLRRSCGTRDRAKALTVARELAASVVSRQ